MKPIKDDDLQLSSLDASAIAFLILLVTHSLNFTLLKSCLIVRE